LTRFQIRK